MAGNASKCGAGTGEFEASGIASSPYRLAVDTCGPSGSVALGRLIGGELEVAGQIELEGRSYSATLVAAVSDLLNRSGVRLNDVGCMVAVNGPGSFTGVRVGLSAVKGLAEPTRIPIVALSRLAVLAAKAGLGSAALDAHRHELFLRLAATNDEPRELLAGAEELAALAPPSAICVCDENSSAILRAAWPSVEQVRAAPPTAADALRLAVPRILAGQFVDSLVLDGHYLRRSDAEIFGERAAACAARK